MSPGQQFNTDLRLIREARGITVDEIHRSSRIPLEMLHHFEQRGLEDHPLFNEVYIRAFVRTYAAAVRVPEDEALAALEAEQADRYQGRLAQRYLGWTPPRPLDPEPDETPEAPPAPPPRQAEAPPPEPPSDATVTNTAAERVPEPTADTATQGGVAPWMIAVLVLVVVGAGLAWWFLGGAPATDTAPPPAPEPVVEETPVAVAPASVALPDTLRLAVVAAVGPLRGFRVQFDDDIRRPYWLEQGDTLTFPFVTSIEVERLGAARYLVEGTPVPDSEDDIVALDRAQVQALLDASARANR